jgi:hypothetical protein
VFQVRLFRYRQPNPPHLFLPPLMRNLTIGYLKKDARSSGACIMKRIRVLVQGSKRPNPAMTSVTSVGT